MAALLEANPDLSDLPDLKGHSPLALACASGAVNVVELLLKSAKPVVNRVDGVGKDSREYF